MLTPSFILVFGLIMLLVGFVVYLVGIAQFGKDESLHLAIAGLVVAVLFLCVFGFAVDRDHDIRQFDHTHVSVSVNH